MATALMISALGALALTSGIALAAGQPHDMGDRPMGDMTRAQAVQMANDHFDRMDANKDGKLDRTDANHDGMISRDEWNAGAAKLAGMHGRGRPMMRHMGMMADMDGDRAISRDEFQKRAMEHFDRVDTNHDGTVTTAEREQAHAAMREHSERK